MAFEGSLSDANLTDVCQLLALASKTGCLTVTDGRRLGEIFFHRGRIAFARILSRRGRSGDLLVRDGVITREQLAAALDVLDREPERRLGDLLVERRWTRAEEIERYVRLDIEDVILHLLTWSHGNFSFISTPRLDAGEPPFAIAVEGLLLEAARRFDEWSETTRETGHRDELGPSSDGPNDNRARNVGIALFRAGMLEDAERKLRRALELCPEDAQARLYLALAALRAGRPNDAVDELATLLETHGPSYSALMNLAVALQQVGRDDDAWRALSEAGRLRPDSSAIALERGIITLRRLHVPDARRWFEVSRERAGPDAVLPARWYYYAGVAAALAGVVENAAACVGEGLGNHPDSALLLQLKGLLAERRGDLDTAEACYTTAVALDAAIAQAHKNLGDIAYRRGALEVALSLLERASELAPDLGDRVYAHLGDLYDRAGNRDAAQRYWKRALDVNPDNDEVKNKLGIVVRGDA